MREPEPARFPRASLLWVERDPIGKTTGLPPAHEGFGAGFAMGTGSRACNPEVPPMSSLSVAPPDWLQTLSQVFIWLSIACAVVVLIDILAGRWQPMWVMDVVWPITALYFGPFGLWAYWVMGRPKAIAHARKQEEGGGDDGGGHGHHGPEKPFWQTCFVATSHCGAGCTLGDTIGETAIFLIGFVWFGSKLLTAYAVDFALAYLFGVAFQFFTIAPMRNLGIKDGLWAAVKADTISLVAFEVGMFGFMALNRLVFFDHPPEPNTYTYWFLMQLAMIVGFATSYPANWWLVKSGIKEKM